MSRITVTTMNDLLAVLHPRMANEKRAIVMVDGYNFTGKSSAARSMAAQLVATLVECDKFVRNGRKTYPESLDLEAIHTVIRRTLHGTGPIIIDSVLALDVAARLHVNPTVHVYVRHSWPTGVYTHHDVLYSSHSEADLLGKENELCRAAGISDEEPILSRELISYHFRHLPQERATMIFDTCFPPE